MMTQILGSVISLILLAALALGVRWMLSATAARGCAESLTPEDLQVLEEAAARLVDEIKQTAAVAVRDLDERCEKLRVLTIQADQRLALLAQEASARRSVAHCSQAVPAEDAAGLKERIYALADEGAAADEIARRTGTPVGEVTLLLGLRPCAQTSSAG